MKLTKIFISLSLVTLIGFSGCKPKDSDIKSKVETAIKADPQMANIMVDVKDGVVTLSGECKDQECKEHCEKAAAGVKGVKSVVNNCTVAAPPPPPVAEPASLTTELDAATQQKVKDGLKDIEGVTVEFAGDKAILSGSVTKANRMKIMQILAAAKVKSDVSKLTDK